MHLLDPRAGGQEAHLQRCRCWPARVRCPGGCLMRTLHSAGKVSWQSYGSKRGQRCFMKIVPCGKVFWPATQISLCNTEAH